MTEQLIQKSFAELMIHRATIVIAHRLSADHILVSDQGSIIEEGSRDELLKQKGYYHHMWQMQAGGFLPESW